MKEEELGQSQIKRHTIDAILGLPRLGGFCLEEEEGESGELDLEEQRAKQKFHLDRDGKLPKVIKFHKVNIYGGDVWFGLV